MTELTLLTLQPHYPPDALGISAQLDVAEEHALSIVRGLTEAQAAWRTGEALPCVGGCIEQYCAWLRLAVPVLDAGVRGVRSGWRARLGAVRSGWWWRLFPRVAEFAPDVLGWRSGDPACRPRPVRQAMAEVLALHAEVRRIVRAGERRDLRVASVQLPGMGPFGCPLDVALAVVPAVFRRLVRRAERVRLASGFPRA